MCKAGLPVLDVYPLTASYPGCAGDVVHLPNSVYYDVEEFLEHYSASEFGISNPKWDHDLTRMCMNGNQR